MSIEESLKIVPHGDVAVMEWDLAREKVNKLSTPVMVRLRELLTEVKSSSFKALVLISRKPKIFIAGADIEEIKRLNTKEDYLKVLAQAHEIFNMLEDLKIPSIAAIHGACLGGGLELSLACDYRICTDDDATKIGLPEVNLGIIPGFGGCVRLPRVIGVAAALDIILAGKSVPGKKALKLGLVDECAPVQSLEEKSLELAKRIAAGEKGKRPKRFRGTAFASRILESPLGLPLVFSQAKKAVLSQSKGFYPAPLKALEVVKKTHGMKNRSKALAIEQEAFVEVAVTDISKNLIDLFFAMESVKKQNGVEDKNIKSEPVQRLGVLGAGTMGGGIAYVAADKGIEVRMKDVNTPAIALGLKSASDIWQKALQRKRINKYDLERKMALVSGGTDFSGFGHVDVVVEAIVEDMEIKKKVLAETADHVPSHCVLATNTSSLSVAEMATALKDPGRFVGMHFFNPVHKMPLVEVIRGPKTSDEAVVRIFELAKKMGKTPVVVKDGPGFLVNRLLMPWMIEGMFLLEDGMAIEKVDRYYTHSFGMPMGPYRLMDEVGLDVCVKVVKIFRKSLGERIEVPKIAEKLAATGRLGKKNGKGFYRYNEKGEQIAADPAVYGELGLKNPTNPVNEKECLERGIFQMINEAARALNEDRIVEKPQDVDLAMIMGTGFPPFRGGLLKYADSVGASYVVEELEIFASRLGARFKPSQPLSNMAKTRRKFYS